MMKNQKGAIYGILFLTITACSLPNKLDIKYDYTTGELQNPKGNCLFSKKERIKPFGIRYLGTPSITIENLPVAQCSVKINEKQSSVVFGNAEESLLDITSGNPDLTFVQPVARGDEINYSVEIITTGTPSGKITVPITVRVGGRWKLDVSSGINFLFGTDDEEYASELQLDGSYKLLQLRTTDDNKNFTLPASMSAMTHIYPKQIGQINIGGSLGIGIQDDGVVRYFGGLGLMLGDRQRGILNVGVVLAKRNVRNEIYARDAILESQTLPEDLLIDAWKVGGFVGVSYNLTSEEK